MIDSVRRTVLAIINKENRGFISPEDFNLFAKQSQLEIFEDYFEEYTNSVTNSLLRKTHSDYADTPKILREKIDVFSEYKAMVYDSQNNLFNLPSDGYRLNNVIYNGIEVEEVYKSQISYLNLSDLTAPSLDFPCYVRVSNSVVMYPTTITSNVFSYYIRKPKDPNWTYQLVNNNPVFNQSDVGYQDLEIHPSDTVKIVKKILEYSGVSIREADIVKLIEQKDILDKQIINR